METTTTNRLAAMFAAAAVTTVVGVGVASASPISYTDTFARNGSLNGSSPTTAPIGATWAANADFVTTLSPAEATLTSPARGTNGEGAILPMAVAAGEIATATVTLTPTGGSTDGNWLALGFASVTGDFNYDKTQGFLLYRGNGQMSYSAGPGNTNGGNGATATYGTPDTFTMTLNNTDAAHPTISFSDSLGKIGAGALNLAYTSDATKIIGVSLGSLDEPGTFTNFSASVVGVPEPASLALLGIGGLMMLSRRRKNKQV